MFPRAFADGLNKVRRYILTYFYKANQLYVNGVAIINKVCKLNVRTLLRKLRMFD